MTEARMSKALEIKEKALSKADRPMVAAAYLLVMPLLWENEAITAYKAKHPAEADALPEVTAVDEAVMLATREFPLDVSQQRRLASLLADPPK